MVGFECQFPTSGGCLVYYMSQGGYGMDLSNQIENSFSRRGFMKGALLGAGALTLSSRLASAEMLLAGKTASDIHGMGVEKGLVRINANENPLGASPRAIEAVAQHMFEMNRYSFSTDLPLKLHKHHDISFGDIELDFEDPASFRKLREMNRVLVSAGSGPIVQMIGVMGVGDGNGEAIESIPGYGQITRVFESFKMAGMNTNVVRVPTKGDFEQDLDAIKAAITPRTTLICLTNPNNPTGALIPYDELVSFVDSVPSNITILLDEAYMHFNRIPGYTDGVKLALSRDNVVVTRTFSKIYGLAGMRIGYAIASKPLLDKMMLHMGFGGGLTVLITYAASAAIEDYSFVNRTLQVTNDGKDSLMAEFDAMGLKYTPSHTNFMIVDLGRDSRRVVSALRKKGVFVRSGYSYATRESNPLENHIRISIGTPDELEVFMSELKQVMGAAS